MSFLPTVVYLKPRLAGLRMFSGGYCAPKRTGWLEVIQVEQGCQGTGIGSGVVKEFEKWCWEQGATVIRAEALADSRKFWAGQGYTVAKKANAKNRFAIYKLATVVQG